MRKQNRGRSAARGRGASGPRAGAGRAPQAECGTQGQGRRPAGWSKGGARAEAKAARRREQGRPTSGMRSDSRATARPMGVAAPGEPARPMPIPAYQRPLSRRLVTNRALWHSGRPIRRIVRPRDSRDLVFLRTREA